MKNQFNVFGSITTTEEHVESVKATLTEIVNNTRKEDGNISYELCQSKDDPNTFFTIEKWENVEAEAKHWEMEHLKKSFEKIGDKLTGAPVVYKGFTVE